MDINDIFWNIELKRNVEVTISGFRTTLMKMRKYIKYAYVNSNLFDSFFLFQYIRAWQS